MKNWKIPVTVATEFNIWASTPSEAESVLKRHLFHRKKNPLAFLWRGWSDRPPRVKIDIGRPESIEAESNPPARPETARRWQQFQETLTRML